MDSQYYVSVASAMCHFVWTTQAAGHDGLMRTGAIVWTGLPLRKYDELEDTVTATCWARSHRLTRRRLHCLGLDQYHNPKIAVGTATANTYRPYQSPPRID